MDYRIKLVAAPTQEPVTLQEAKDWARISDDSLDGIITGLIKSGREEAEKYIQWVLMEQIWELSFDTLPSMPIEVPRIPLQVLDAVKIIDTNGAELAMDINDFVVSSRSGKVYFRKDKTWPAVTLQKYDSVIFTYKAGYTAPQKIPEAIKSAIKLYVSHRIDNPESTDVPTAFYNLLNSCMYVPPS